MKVLRLLLLGLTVPCAVWCLLAMSAAWWWPGELASHWSRHAALLLIPAMAAWRFNAVVCGPLCLAFVAGLAPWLDSVPLPSAPGPRTLSVVSANMLYLNRQADSIPTILDQGADVVMLCELWPPAGDLQRIQDPRYPFTVSAVRKGGFNDAMALLSRYPLREIQIRDESSEPWITALVEVPGGSVRLVAVHPEDPTRQVRSIRRDRQLGTFAALAAASVEPVVVAGDFNCTVGSPAWRPLAAAGLAPSSGFRPGTWPAGFPIGHVRINLGLAGIRIDHVLARGAVVRAERVFTIPGSDHRGIRADLALP